MYTSVKFHIAERCQAQTDQTQIGLILIENFTQFV